MRLIPKITKQSTAQSGAEIRSKFVRQEAKIGGELFGPIPAGHEREFFCLDERTWIWYEQWRDAKGKRQVITTRYDVRPSGVIKMQDGQPYRRLDATEALNLYKAIDQYERQVGSMYQQLLRAA